MPNTVVKLINAESTWLEAAWEDRKLLIKKERDTQKCVSFFVMSAWEGRTAERETPVWEQRVNCRNGFCIRGAFPAIDSAGDRQEVYAVFHLL